MKKLIIIIGDNFTGGILFYKALLSTLKINRISATPVPIVSSKKVLGFGNELIISQYLSEIVKDEPWAYRVPGQPGYYLIKDIDDSGIGVMTIPARGKATMEFINSISATIDVITVMLKPESLSGTMSVLLNDFDLSDSVAVNIYNSYTEHPEWRDDICNVSLTVEYKDVMSLSKMAPQYIRTIIDNCCGNIDTDIHIEHDVVYKNN